MPYTNSPKIKALCMPSVTFAQNSPILLTTLTFLCLQPLARLLTQLLHIRSVIDKRLLLGLALTLITIVSTSTFAADTRKERWYRYYENGIPMLSSTVSEQHMSHGYDVLDNHMLVIRHVPPFSTLKYDQQKVMREQAIEKQIADRHLIETYTSSSRAELQRTREINELDNQIKRAEQQTKELEVALNNNISQAASFERVNKPIPAFTQTQLEKNRALLSQSTANTQSLKTKREQSLKQFAYDILQLKRIERQRLNNQPSTTTSNAP